MPIDWFTVIAQAINFLILVWLLKRFLYKPILTAIDEREKGIAAQLSVREDTVKSHVGNILEKLGANDRTHAVTIGLKRGIIDL